MTTHEHSDPVEGGLTHIQNSVIWNILPDLLVFTVIAAVITTISELVHPLSVASTILTLMGTVLGFVVSYRTSSAYERYTEGRRLWAAVTLASRTFARVCWLHTPNYVDLPDPGEHPSDDNVVKSLVEKKTMINLCGAFCVALKHYLRGESGIYYKDLFPLVCFLPKYHLPSSTYLHRQDLDQMHRATDPLGTADSVLSSPQLSTSLLINPMDVESLNPSLNKANSDYESPQLPGSIRMTPQSSTDTTTSSSHHFKSFSTATTAAAAPGATRRLVSPVPLLPSRNPPMVSITEYIPFYPLFRDLFLVCRGRAKTTIRNARGQRRKRPPIQFTEGQKSGENVPLEITLLMSGWVSALQHRKTVDVPTTNALLGAVQSFSDSLTGLERILLTPIPLGYSLHLRHVCWVYLALLPSQIWSTLHWLTIPATFIASFVFLGFIEIGQQIESPFGYDPNDLDLDAFNRTILRELRELTAHPPSESDPASFCFVKDNLPFATAPLYEGKSAVQLTGDGTTSKDIEDLLKHRAGARMELRRMDSLVAAAEKVAGQRGP